jgi:hypothetical protein
MNALLIRDLTSVDVAMLRMAARQGTTLVYTRDAGYIPPYRDLDSVRFPVEWELYRTPDGRYQVVRVRYSLWGAWVPGGWYYPPECPCFEWAGYEEPVNCPTFAAAWRALLRLAG